jgi:DNA repair photolyase
MDLNDPLDFEREIYVKVNAPAVLATTAGPEDLRGRPVAIGTATDPYQPAERRFGITRRLLETLAPCPTLDLSITTKSDLILRDLDLLVAIGRTRPLRVHVSLTSMDAGLLRKIEPGAPTPERRVATVAALRAAGVVAGLYVMPILPRITGEEADLDRLFAAARGADASFVAASLLHLRTAPRRRFLPFLAEQFPEHLAWYRAAYARSAFLRGPVRDEIVARVRRLRTRYGFARGDSTSAADQTQGADQLSFGWGAAWSSRATRARSRRQKPRASCPR